MERFYIITNLMKDPDYAITKEIQDYIEQHGRECILAKEDEQGFILPERYRIMWIVELYWGETVH